MTLKQEFIDKFLHDGVEPTWLLDIWKWIDKKIWAEKTKAEQKGFKLGYEFSYNKAIDDCVGVVEHLVRLHSNDDSDYSIGASDVAYAILKSLEQLKE